MCLLFRTEIDALILCTTTMLPRYGMGDGTAYRTHICALPEKMVLTTDTLQAALFAMKSIRTHIKQITAPTADAVWMGVLTDV